MDVTTTKLQHSSASLAGMTMNELRCLATRLRISHWENGIRLKKGKLIERISESFRREKTSTQLLPALFAAQRTREVAHADDPTCNQSITACQQSSTESLRKVIRRHYKFVRRRRQEKKMLYKRKLRNRCKALYEREGREKARVKYEQEGREKARIKYEQEGREQARSVYEEKGRVKARCSVGLLENPFRIKGI